MTCEKCSCQECDEESRIFQDPSYTIDVSESGEQIEILFRTSGVRFHFCISYSLPFLEKAVLKAKKLRDDKE